MTRDVIAPGRPAASERRTTCWSWVSRRIPRFCGPSVRLSRVLELVALETAVQRASRKAQRARRLAHVAVARHGLLDQERLDVFEAHVLETSGARAFAAQAEVARADRGALRHQHGSLHRMIDLADVAGPPVIEQHLHG